MIAYTLAGIVGFILGVGTLVTISAISINNENRRFNGDLYHYIDEWRHTTTHAKDDDPEDV